MKLNIANPATGAQRKIEIDDEHRLQVFMDRRMAEEISGDSLGDEFKGYVFKITGGNDSEGFPMRQGVLVNKRVKLLLRRGMKCFHPTSRVLKKRKAVRGCIIGPDIASLNMIIIKRGEKDLPGLTDDDPVPRRLGPKRVGKIMKMFNLTWKDDVNDYVVRRKVVTKSGNKILKKPKIQRLITPRVIARRKSEKRRLLKRRENSRKKRKAYYDMLEKRQSKLSRKKQKIEEAVQEEESKPKGRRGRH